MQIKAAQPKPTPPVSDRTFVALGKHWARSVYTTAHHTNSSTAEKKKIMSSVRSPRSSRHASMRTRDGTDGGDASALSTNYHSTGSLAHHSGDGNNGGSEKGLLTTEKVSASLSMLGHTPEGQLVFLRSHLSGLGLVNIDILGQKFANLQSINLDRNRLTSLEGLKGMKHLTVLSAAHNNITAAGVVALIGAGRSDDEAYGGPRGDSDEYNPLRRTLQRVILHHNKIEDARCIRGFEYAYEIDLSFNRISGEIGDKCVAHMASLGALSLANNRISAIDVWAFEGCHALQHLDVSHNELAKFDFVSFIAGTLKTLRAGFNAIMEAEPLGCLKRVAELDLSSNNIYDLGEVAHLAQCTALRTLHLCGNPVMKEGTAAAAEEGSGGGASAGGGPPNLGRSGGASRAAGGGGDGSAAADGSDDHEGAATDEVEDDRLRHRLANFQVDVTAAGGVGGRSAGGAAVTKNNGGGGDTKASRNLASLAARKQQQQQHGGASSHPSSGGAAPQREVVATPFSEMYLHLSRQKELNMEVANVIRRTAQLLKTSQENDVAAGRMGESMRFDGVAGGTSSLNHHQSRNANNNGTTAAGGANGSPSSASNITSALGGQSGASTMLLSPEEEDTLELQQLSPDQQVRLKVLWRLGSVAVLDGTPVTAEELALAQCLAGGTDRKQRQEAKDRAFGAPQPFFQNTQSQRGGGPAAGGASSAIHSLRHR